MPSMPTAKQLLLKTICDLPDTHCNENPIVFLFWELRGFSPNFHIHVSVSDLYIPRIGPHISCSRIVRPILEIYKSLTDTIYECRNWETENYNSVLEITVSYLGTYNWEPDIYIGFCSARDWDGKDYLRLIPRVVLVEDPRLT